MRDFRSVSSAHTPKRAFLEGDLARFARALGPLLGLMSFVTAGCAAKRDEVTPETTVRAMAAHMSRGELSEAYELMSSTYRERVPLAQFREHFEESPVEMAETADALDSPVKSEQTARVELADGRQIELTYAEDGWQIVTPVAEFYSQRTPRDALRTFVRAVRRSRWDVLLRLMPDRDRTGVDAATLEKGLAPQREELERLVALLEASLEEPIEVVGDRATMPYGESYTARLLRENDVWKVEDPE